MIIHFWKGDFGVIKSFLFENFKSFEKAELYLEDFTTLIGTNASGKSNAIEGIKILSELASGLDITTVLDGSRNTQAPIRGGSKSCCRFRQSKFRLGCVVDLDDKYDLVYDIKIKVSNRVYVEEEGLYKVTNDGYNEERIKIFKTKSVKEDSGDIKVEYNNGTRGRNPDITCIRRASILAQMQTKMSREEPVYKENGEYIDLVIDNLKNIIVLNPIPAEMRDYCRKNDIEIRSNCENISAILAEVCSDKNNRERLLKAVRDLPEVEISDIEFVDTKLGDVTFALREKYGSYSTSVDARMLSDGTLRTMAMLAVALLVPEHSMIVIEEIDNGIHPGKIKRMIQYLSEISRERKIDMIITTHNATLLNQYDKDKLLGTTIVYRDKEKATSNFIAFIDIEDYASLLTSGGLGDALIHEELINAIKNEKKKIDISWLVN